jgi:glycerate kinase
MRILVAPDGFKESMPADGVARAIAAGVAAARSDAQVVCLPLADGGEGTLDTLLAAGNRQGDGAAARRPGQRRTIATTNAIGQPVEASVGLIDGAATALIELAQAAGMAQLPAAQRDPLRTTTFGVGTMIRAALETGVGRIIVTLGGSATVDGGAGLIQALGATLIDRAGDVMPAGIGGGRLADVARLDAERLHPGLAEARVTVAVDVLNPALGTHGAAREFGPQKGADPRAVDRLEAGMRRWVDLLEGLCGRALRDEPGTGAAGGAALPLLALANADVTPGIDLVFEAVGLAGAIMRSDLVITGEGRLDRQSGMGKVVGGVVRMAETAGVPCVIVCGSTGDGHEAIAQRADRCICLQQLAGSAVAAMRDAEHWLTAAGRLACDAG